MFQKKLHTENQNSTHRDIQQTQYSLDDHSILIIVNGTIKIFGVVHIFVRKLIFKANVIGDEI